MSKLVKFKDAFNHFDFKSKPISLVFTLLKSFCQLYSSYSLWCNSVLKFGDLELSNNVPFTLKTLSFTNTASPFKKFPESLPLPGVILASAFS